MLATQTNVMNLLIGKNIARTSNVQITDYTNATTYIADGEVAVVDASGTVLDTTTVANKVSIYLVQGQGLNSDGSPKPLIWSDEIFKSSVSSFTGKAYTAGTVQIDYIGYDAVTNTGSIDVINDNDYTIRLRDIDSTTFGTLGNDKYGFYTSDSSATQQEVAVNLTESLFTNTRDLVHKPVTIEMVADASATYTAVPANLTVVNGSIKVTTSNTTGITVGSLIRIGSSADTSAVYEVDAVVTNTSFNLNYPYQGTSGTVLAANAGILTNVTGFGIRVTGNAPYFVAPNLTQYHVNRWETTISNAGSTPVVTEQNATEGSGAYGQIASLEYFLLGNEGHSAREGVIPQISPRATAEATGTYSMIYLAHSRTDAPRLMNPPISNKQLIIAFNKLGGFIANSQATNATTTSVETVLENWLTTFPSITI